MALISRLKTGQPAQNRGFAVFGPSPPTARSPGRTGGCPGGRTRGRPPVQLCRPPGKRNPVFEEGIAKIEQCFFKKKFRRHIFKKVYY